MDNISDVQICEAVTNCTSYTKVLKSLGLASHSRNITKLKTRVQDLGISTSHFKNPFPPYVLELEDILVPDSNYDRRHLKARLIKQGILKEVCYECGQGPIWNNKPMTLQLDHINGMPKDNRIENLRILCPNCHATTEHYAVNHRYR